MFTTLVSQEGQPVRLIVPFLSAQPNGQDGNLVLNEKSSNE